MLHEMDSIFTSSYHYAYSWYAPYERVIYWNKFGMPDKRPDPLYSFGSTGWWVDPAKEAALAGKKNAEQPVTETAQAAPTPAPAETTQASSAPAAPAEQAVPGVAAAERGQSPVIYAVGAIVVFVVAYLLGRRRRKSP